MVKFPTGGEFSRWSQNVLSAYPRSQKKRGDFLYAKSLHIYDFKCFGEAELRLQYPGRTGRGVSELKNVNIVLGDNGAGKSSVLRALAIAVLAPALLESGFVPYRLVRRSKQKQLRVTPSILKVDAVADKEECRSARLDSKSLDLVARIDRREGGSLDRLSLANTRKSLIAKTLYDDFSPAFFVVGYGATRRVETSEYSESSARRSRGLRYQRVAGLFEDQVALRPLRTWLYRLQQKGLSRYEEAIELFNRVLPENLRFSGQFNEAEDQYIFDFNGLPTPLSSLSDGYKSFIGWVGDLIGHLADVAPNRSAMDQVTGIVLVDEIDLHLHPEWQRSVVPSIAAAFPKLQFVFTTHSPIITSTVRRENVFVAETAEDGTATIKQLREHVYGRGVEQLLLSSYFGLLTTRPNSFKSEVQELFQQAAAGDSRAALEYLKRLTAPVATSGPNRKRRAVAR